MLLQENRKFFIVIGLLLVLALFEVRGLTPVYGGTAAAFEIFPGDGFEVIVNKLETAGFIRSRTAFIIAAVTTGRAGKLKPGVYELNANMSSLEILNDLVLGTTREIQITIPEGSNVYEIDSLLSDAGVSAPGIFSRQAILRGLEGRLFPDTYYFFLNSPTDEIFKKFSTNFQSKTQSLLDSTSADFTKYLTLASIVQKEVPDSLNQKIVAGILENRLGAGMPLQVDATICYIKRGRLVPGESEGCYPLSPLDFKIDSPYNTYLHKGLPPGPIGNPGIEAIQAVLSPKKTDYWYYLSDPASKRTIYSKTLDEQEQNRVKYLR